MTNKIKSGILVGVGVTLFYISKTLIGWITGEEQSSDEIYKSVFASLSAGLATGLLASWVTDKYLVNTFLTNSINFELENGETSVFQTSANHFKGSKTFGGSLCLTDQRLMFKSHNSNFESDDWSISLGDIAEVKTFRNLGLVQNGLSIKTKNEVIGKFVVDKIKRWEETISNSKTAYNNALPKYGAGHPSNGH